MAKMIREYSGPWIIRPTCLIRQLSWALVLFYLSFLRQYKTTFFHPKGESLLYSSIGLNLVNGQDSLLKIGVVIENRRPRSEVGIAIL